MRKTLLHLIINNHQCKMFVSDKAHIVFYPLKVLFYSGFHPKTKSIVLNAMYYFNFAGMGFLLALGAMGFLTSYDHDINFAVESLQTCILFVHSMGKHAVLHYNKESIEDLLDASANFWKVADFSGDVARECLGIMRLGRIFTVGFLCMGLCVISMFYIQPFITGALPTILYTPEGWDNFLIGSFWYLCYFMYASNVGLDAFFVALCTPVIVQFKLLGYRFKNMQLVPVVDAEEFGKLIEYHNFLLDYCRKINRMANGVFLLQFLISTSAICLQLYIISQKDFALGNKIKCLVYLTAQISETAIYFFSAELISAASDRISGAVYESAWPETGDGEVKRVTLIMARSQRQVAFSGYGLVWINLETFTLIFKTAMSFYTYLKTIEEH